MSSYSPSLLLDAAEVRRDRFLPATRRETQEPVQAPDAPRGAGHSDVAVYWLTVVEPFLGDMGAGLAPATVLRDGQEHWFLRVTLLDGASYDVDILGDCIERPALQVAPGGQLYADARLRRRSDFPASTAHRFSLLEPQIRQHQTPPSPRRRSPR